MCAKTARGGRRNEETTAAQAATSKPAGVSQPEYRPPMIRSEALNMLFRERGHAPLAAGVKELNQAARTGWRRTSCTRLDTGEA